VTCVLAVDIYCRVPLQYQPYNSHGGTYELS